MPESNLSVGNVEIIGITDIEVDFPMPLTEVFPNVPLEAWSPYQQRFPGAFPRPDVWHPHFGGFLLRSQGRTILVDTGMGSRMTNPGAVEMFTGGVDGQLLEELQSIETPPEDIDTVFFTHLHPDHVGWNLRRGDGGAQATFPNARYVTHEADWNAFKQSDVQEAFPFPFWDETLGPLEHLGVLDLLSGEHALTGEITAIPTPGHTPGSMSLSIASAGERAVIIGDVVTNPAQVTETEWVFAFDMASEQAVLTRKQVIDRAEADDALVIACHFPHPGHGRLIRLEGRRYWQGGL